VKIVADEPGRSPCARTSAASAVRGEAVEEAVGAGVAVAIDAVAEAGDGA
jgi:hypothetical protein